MEFTLSGTQIRNFSNAIYCISKVGHSSEVTFEAIPNKIMLRTLNSSKTAFMSVTFKSEFFDHFKLLNDAASVTFCIYVKALLSVFRTPSTAMDSLNISFDASEAPKVEFVIQCLSGIRKTYILDCVEDREILSAEIDKDSFPSHIVVKPRDLARLLVNFQSNLSEITLIATELVSTPSVTDSLAQEHKAVELRSYSDPIKSMNEGTQNLHTQLWIDPSEEFQQYCHGGEAVDVTFSIKELRGLMVFCESVDTDIKMYFDKAGAPVLFTPEFAMSESNRVDFDATLVIASMMESQLRPPEPAAGQQKSTHTNMNHTEGSQGTRGAQSGGNVESFGTRIWSELSGSRNQESGSRGQPLAAPVDPTPPQPRNLQDNFDSCDASEEIERTGISGSRHGYGAHSMAGSHHAAHEEESTVPREVLTNVRPRFMPLARDRGGHTPIFDQSHGKSHVVNDSQPNEGFRESVKRRREHGR